MFRPHLLEVTHTLAQVTLLAHLVYTHDRLPRRHHSPHYAISTHELITSHARPHHPFMRVQASFVTPSKRLHAKPQPHHALKHAHQLQRQMHAVIMRDRGAWYHSAIIWVHFPSSAGIVPLNRLLYKLLPKPHSTASTWPPERRYTATERAPL